MHNKVPKNEYLKGKPGKKKDAFKKDVIYDPRGQWDYPGEVTKIPSGNITMQGVPYPVLGVDNLGYEEMMYPGLDYQFPGDTVTEYPQMQYGGDPSIPELNQAKKGGWLNKYQDGAETQGMTGSMKGAIAYGYMYGNPAAQRMVNPYTNPYIWTGNEPGAGVPSGNTGTHFMASMDNYAVPFIQQGPNGLYYNEMANPSNPEAFQFNTPEEAEYFAEHYKDVAPAFQKKGGNINKYSKLPKKTSSKNIKTSINKLMVKNPLFERNYMLYGAKGPRLYDPSSKYQVGGSYADSLALYNLSQGQVNAIKRDPNLINSNRETGFTGAPGKSVQSSSAYKRLSTNPSIYTYAPGISTNPYSSYYHPTILPTGTFNYNLGTVPSGTLAIPTYKKPVGSVLKSELVKTPEQKARELTPIESKLTPMEVAPEPALYKPVTPAKPQSLYKKTQEPNMPPFYWKFDPVAKQWYQISESAYTNAPAEQKKRGGNIGGLNNYQTGGVTINSEEEYQKSLLMKNKTKERMDAERAWAAKKVAAANAAKAKKPAPSAQQLFGIQPIAAESTGVNKTPQAVLDLKNKTALSFHKAVKDRVKANPNLSIEEAQSQLNAEWLYANGKAQGQGVIRQADPEQGLLSKTVEVVSHPFNALDAYVQSGYVPDYFSHSKDAVNPMDIAYSFTPFGAYAVGADFLYNQLPKQLGEGNYLGATIGAASVLPFFKFNKVLGPETRLSSYLRPVSETESAAIQFTKPKNLSAKIRNPNETLDALRSRGQYWDKSGIQGKEILHPDMIEYHGTYSGRPIVEVKMPDGSSEYFYKSTGWAGKSGSGVQGTTEGQWQVYGQHMSTPGSNNWFIKGPDYQSFYGSKTFEDMANNLDFALSQKYQVQPGELNNILNFQNRMSNVDSFIPGMKRGGWLKEEEYKKGGTPRKSGKKLVNYSQNPNFVKTQSTSWLDKYQ